MRWRQTTKGLRVACCLITYVHRKRNSDAEEKRRGGRIPPPTATVADPASRNSVVPVSGCQEIIDDKISYVIAQPLTGRKVEEEMLASKNAA